MATFRELLGDAFKEGMTFEEAEQALNGKNLADLATGQYVSVSKYNALMAEKDDFKAKYTSTLSDAQRAEQEALEREAHFKSIEKENAIYRYTKKMSSTIKDDAILTEIATLMAEGKFDDAIDKQNSYIAAEKVALEQQIKADLMATNPQGNPQANGGGAITKEQFASMGVAERTKLFNEQPDLYKQLNSN